MCSIVATLLMGLTSLHVDLHVTLLDLDRELLIELLADYESSDSNGDVENDSKGEEFYQSVDEAGLVVVITVLPFEPENDISFKDGLIVVLSFDDFLVVLDGL